MPSFLADTYGPGPHGVLLFSFLPACLSVRLSVRPYIRSVLPFRVCLLCLAFSRTAEISFRMLSRAFPEASLFPPPRTRDGALSFLRATRDAKSSRPPLLLERYLSCAASCRILVVELCKDGKWNTYITY